MTMKPIKGQKPRVIAIRTDSATYRALAAAAKAENRSLSGHCAYLLKVRAEEVQS